MMHNDNETCVKSFSSMHVVAYHFKKDFFMFNRIVICDYRIVAFILSVDCQILGCFILNGCYM